MIYFDKIRIENIGILVMRMRGWTYKKIAKNIGLTPSGVVIRLSKMWTVNPELRPFFKKPKLLRGAQARRLWKHKEAYIFRELSLFLEALNEKRNQTK